MPGVGNFRIWLSHTFVGEPCFMISICHLGTTNLHLHITSHMAGECIVLGDLDGFFTTI